MLVFGPDGACAPAFRRAACQQQSGGISRRVCASGRENAYPFI
ncbi:hypothetical protein CLOSTASPAR_03877 [[Clostridium] asparagiforme DSM 15981]|uniref:Uncharacterized protein n=1 Tax=[Clostridium] asparagiforme DSM 15981 TaxID=518636 RepID=C0D3N6_9FIRM|nr:hypothetical protein CLOSTASPAR_03877 [[Clostridium] asparagiforme DSM 15981]